MIDDLPALIYGAMEETITIVERDKLKVALTNWLTTQTRLKPVPDLDQKLINYQRKIAGFCDNLHLKLTDGLAEIKAYGDAGQTMAELTYGTDWFVGHPDLVKMAAKILLGQE